MILKAEDGKQTQPEELVKGEYLGWKYEIDANYETQFRYYISKHWNDSILGAENAKNGMPECFKHLRTLEGPDTVKIIGPYTFANCKKLVFVMFNGCNIISNHAFENCELLRHAQLPSVKVVKSFSFYGAGTASEVCYIYIPEAIEIEANSFNSCGSSTLSFPALGRLTTHTIINCPNLSQVSVPSALAIEDQAIAHNKNLKKVYAPSLRQFRKEQVDNVDELELFVMSQEAKQALVRNQEDVDIPSYLVGINEYEKSEHKPKRK